MTKRSGAYSSRMDLFSFEVLWERGGETAMEDKILLEPFVGISKSKGYIVGIYDGYNGDKISKFVRNAINGCISETEGFASGNYSAALVDAHIALNDALRPDSPLSERDVKRWIQSPEFVKLDEDYIDGIEYNRCLPCCGKMKDLETGGRRVLKCSLTTALGSFNHLVGGLMHPLRMNTVLRNAQVSGCSAVTALVIDGSVHVANLGTCALLACYSDATTHFTARHNRQDPKEQERLEAAAQHGGSAALLGQMTNTRGIGDHRFKNYSLSDSARLMLSSPEVVSIQLVPELETLVLASSGVWDCVSPETMRSTIAKYRNMGVKGFLPSVYADLKASKAGNSLPDNVSIVVLNF